MKMQLSPAHAAKLKDADFFNGTGPSAYDLSRLQWNNFGGYGAVAPAQGSAPVSKMRQLNKNLTFVITNSSTTVQTVTLFNVAYGGTSPTFADKVSVAVRQSNYTAVLNSIQASNGFKIAGMKYLVRERTQFNNTFLVGTRDFMGHTTSDPYTVLDNTSAMNNQSLELDDPNFEYNVDITTFFEIDVNGTDVVATTGEQVTLICTIAGYVNPSNDLNLQPALNVNPTGFNNGLPDMTTTLVINPSSSFGPNVGTMPNAQVVGGQSKGLFK